MLTADVCSPVCSAGAGLEVQHSGLFAFGRLVPMVLQHLALCHQCFATSEVSSEWQQWGSEAGGSVTPISGDTQCCFCKMSHPVLSLGPCTQCCHSTHTLLKPPERVLGGCPVCCKTACCLFILPPDTLVPRQPPAIACRRAGSSFWEFSTYQNKVPPLGLGCGCWGLNSFPLPSPNTWLEGL